MPAVRPTIEMATQRLESLCVRGEHCRQELHDKLRKWGFNSNITCEILDGLAARRFFDDRRYALSFARDKILYNHWGKMKVRLGLKAKRINPDFIVDALDEIDDEEYESVAKAFLTSKARSVKEGFSFEGKTKLYRAGLSRGFESSLVSQIVKSPETWGIEPE